MANKINKVTAAVIQAMKKKSALGLPDRPSEAGLTPTQIKTAFADFVTGPTQSALAEIDRVATEVTAVLSKLFEGVYDELPTDLTRFENGDKIILTNGSIYKYNANQGAFVKTNDELESIVSAHIAAQNNPHNVTKTQLGLSNVENKSSATIRSEIEVSDIPELPQSKITNLQSDLANRVLKSTTIMGINLQDDITLAEVKTAIGEATSSLSGLMSAQDKQNLDTLVALLETDDADTVVNTIAEILQIFDAYPEGASLVTALAGKVDKEQGKVLSTNDYDNTEKQNVAAAYTHSQITSGNPHQVTKSDLGLGKVENKTSAEIRSEITVSDIPVLPQSKISNLTTDLGKKLDKNYSSYPADSINPENPADANKAFVIVGTDGVAKKLLLRDLTGYIGGATGEFVADAYYPNLKVGVADKISEFEPLTQTRLLTQDVTAGDETEILNPQPGLLKNAIVESIKGVSIVQRLRQGETSLTLVQGNVYFVVSAVASQISDGDQTVSLSNGCAKFTASNKATYSLDSTDNKTMVFDLSAMRMTDKTVDELYHLLGYDYYPFGITTANPQVMHSVGDNLFDWEYLYSALKEIDEDNVEIVVKDGRRCLKITDPRPYSHGNVELYKGAFTPGVQYKALSETLNEGEAANRGFYLRFIYTDGYDSSCLNNSTSLEWKSESAVSTSEKNISHIEVDFGDRTVSVYINIDKLALYHVSNPETEYLPYKEDSLEIPQVLDEYPALPNGVANEIILDKGMALRRIGKAVFDGSESDWVFQTTGSETILFFNSVGLDAVSSWASTNNSITNFFNLAENIIISDFECYVISSTVRFFVRILKNRLPGYQDSWTNTEKVNAFKQWLAGQHAAGTPLTVYYELAQPEIVTFEPVSNTIQCWNYGRESVIGGPVNITITYPISLLLQTNTNTDILTEHKKRLNNTEEKLANKVDKVSGMGLSSNDFTDTYKQQITHNANDIITINSTLTQKADLGPDGKVLPEQMPDISITDTYSASSQTEMLSLNAQTGDVCIRYDLEAQDEPSVYILKGSDPSQLSHWQLLPVPSDRVWSVNSKTGIVNLTQDDIGSGVYNKVFTGTEKTKLSNVLYETVLYENASGFYVEPIEDAYYTDLNISGRPDQFSAFSAIVIEWAPLDSPDILYRGEFKFQFTTSSEPGVESKTIISEALEIQQFSFQFQVFELASDWVIRFFPAMVVEYRYVDNNWRFAIDTSPYRIYRILGYKK